jgi:hypothetical protein
MGKLAFAYFENIRFYTRDILKEQFKYSEYQITRYFRDRWNTSDLVLAEKHERAAAEEFVRQVKQQKLTVVFVITSSQMRVFDEHIQIMGIENDIIYRDHIGAVNSNYPKEGRKLFVVIFSFDKEY